MTPPPLSLEQLTPDVTKAAYLERMLDKNAASYKHYWLRAIVEELAEGHREMSFTALVAHHHAALPDRPQPGLRRLERMRRR